MQYGQQYAGPGNHLGPDSVNDSSVLQFAPTMAATTVLLSILQIIAVSIN
jgi:hypothetical protein